MEIKDLLLPRGKYVEESKKYGPSPFSFEIKKSGKVLYYFGANHSNNSENAQYQKLRKYWNDFLIEAPENRIVLIEGRIRPLAKYEEEAIKNDAEAGWVTYSANQVGIEVVCPDIKSEDLLQIKPDIDRDLWELARSIRRLEQRQRNKEDFSDLITEKLKYLYRKYVGKELDVRENFNNLVNPNRNDTLINKVIKEHSDLREEKIVAEILKYWNEGKNIFVIFGSGHLIIQKPALEVILR